MTRWIPLLALLIAAPAAGKPRPTEPPPPAPAATETPGVTPEQKAAAFRPYDEAMSSGNKNAAAEALLAIVDDPAQAPLHGEAWVKLGDLLVGFDMKYSALLAYTRGIGADPVTAAFKVGPAMDLAEELGDTRVIGPALAKNVGVQVDKQTRSRMAYLAARQMFQDGSLGAAYGILMMVDKDSDVYAEAQMLLGVVLANQGRYNDALVPFVTADALADKTESPKRFRNAVNLNVGRAYYSAGNFPRAIEYYAKVERGSEYWPEATFERAWAHFRIDDMNGTLGLLENHDTPFFEGWYFPEAALLRTYALFLMCKFPSANREIDAFTTQYKPVREELDRTLSGMSPEDAWEDVLAYRAGKDTKLPAMILRPYAWEDRIAGAIESVRSADDELERLKNVSANVYAQRAREILKERKREIIETEGKRVLARANAQRDELAQMLDNVQITKLDIMQYETQLYEQASATGKLDYGDRIGQLRKLRKQKGTRVWPYEGEVWADELGYYRYDARPDCPQSLTPTGPAK